jgi:hypothetical protein
MHVIPESSRDVTPSPRPGHERQRKIRIDASHLLLTCAGSNAPQTQQKKRKASAGAPYRQQQQKKQRLPLCTCHVRGPGDVSICVRETTSPLYASHQRIRGETHKQIRQLSKQSTLHKKPAHWFKPQLGCQLRSCHGAQL